MTLHTTEQRPPSAYDVYIRVFGRLEVESGVGTVSEGKSPVPWLLLKYLLVNQGCEVELDELLETIWPSERSDKEESAVRVRLTRLRSFLDPIGLGGKHGLVVHHKMNFILNPDYNIRTDADEFTELLAELRRCPVEDPRGLDLCGQALELYRGTYLQYTEKDFWFESIQESYHKDFCSLALDTAERINATENSEALSLLSRRVMALAPDDLELHRAVLGCMTRFSGETVRKRYVTQMMRSGCVADWLSTL